MKKTVSVKRWQAPPAGLANDATGLAASWLFDHQGVVVDAAFVREIETPSGLDLWAQREIKRLGIRRGLVILCGKDLPEFAK